MAPEGIGIVAGFAARLYIASWNPTIRRPADGVHSLGSWRSVHMGTKCPYSEHTQRLALPILMPLSV